MFSIIEQCRNRYTAAERKMQAGQELCFWTLLGLKSEKVVGRIGLPSSGRGERWGLFNSIPTSAVDFKLFCVQSLLESLLEVFPSLSDARDAAQKPPQ